MEYASQIIIYFIHKPIFGREYSHHRCVTGTLTMNWGSIAVCMIIIGTIVGGIFVRTLRKRYAMHFSKQELEKYGFAEKGLWIGGIGLMVIVLITYPCW